MPINLKGRHFLTLLDFSPEEIQYLLDLSVTLKNSFRAGQKNRLLDGKSIALLFEKTSTRTRCAFAVAASSESAHPEYLGKNDIQMGKKESIKDTARVLCRFFDGIEYRGFEHSIVEELARYSYVPVWNGLTDLYHPTQVLADFLTIYENFRRLKGIRLVYVGDGRNNVANSLMIGSAKMGLDFVISAPENLFPEETLINKARDIASETRASINFETDCKKAVKDADVIYTDVWVSMGEEDKPGIAERIESLRPYQVNSELFRSTRKDSTIFMHCLPAHHTHGIHDMEVTEDIFESGISKVFDEAENRLHTIKAIMVATL